MGVWENGEIARLWTVRSGLAGANQFCADAGTEGRTSQVFHEKV